MMSAVLRGVVVATLAMTTVSEAGMVRKPVVYALDGAKFEGVLVYDDAVKSPRPGLLLVPNWLGINEANLKQAAEVAGKQFVVFVADMYGVGVRPSGSEAAMKLVGPLKKDRARMRALGQAALSSFLGTAQMTGLDATRVGAVGFCFGGTAVLELAKSGAKLAGVVSIHGGLDAPVPTTQKPTARILALHGADDPTVSEADLKAFKDDLRRVRADWILVEFGNAVHSFTDVGANVPGRSMYDAKTARRAFEMMRDFFAESFASR